MNVAGPSRLAHAPLPSPTSGSKFVVASPWKQVKGEIREAREHAASSTTPAGREATVPIPKLEFNLFRSNSIYSVVSLRSVDTLSTDTSSHCPEWHDARDLGRVDGYATAQTGESSRPATPTTPRRATEFQHYHEEDRSRTPTRSTRTDDADEALMLTPTRQRQQQSYFEHDGADHGRSHTPVHHRDQVDVASLHGEQGSEWGEDDYQHEWLDKDGMPTASSSGEGPRSGRRKLRKLVVIPRRAAPPPPPPGLRASPPGPASAGLPSGRNADYPSAGPPTASASSSRYTQADSPQSQYSALPPPDSRPRFPSASPVMIPMHDGDGPSRPSHDPHMSMQSMSFSIYDIGQDSSSRSSTPTASSSTPRGTHTKVPASRLEHADHSSPSSSDRTDAASTGPRTEGQTRPPPQDTRVRTVSEEPKTPEDMVRRGLEARALGDLAKSAYYFMRAADMGSMAGRLYWGMALKYGHGVAKDEKRGFAELLRACDGSLVRGGVDPRLNRPVQVPSAKEKAETDVLLGVGLFEIGNCFLEGAGVKKSPEVAVSYLRLAGDLGDIAAAEQLGSLYGKGCPGIKKDMHESARWYRRAVTQGSNNIVGLTWIWKDKYNE